MMNEQERLLSDFTALFRTLRLRMKDIKAENAQLRTKIAGLEDKISQLNDQLQQARSNYDTLKMAKMIEVTDSDLTQARNRVNKLIREVNKCINLLSDK